MPNLDEIMPGRGLPPGGGPPRTEESAWRTVPFFGEHIGETDLQMMVEWLNPATGRYERKGHLAITGGETELLHNWRHAGTFRLTLVSLDGNLMSEETKLITIAEDHAVLRQFRGGRDDGTPATMMAASGGDLGAVRELIRIHEENMKLERERIAQREREVAERESRAKESHEGAVAIMQDRIQAATQTVMEQQTRSAEAALSSQSNGFHQLMLLMQAQQENAAAREREANAAMLARLQLINDQERDRAQRIAEEAERRAAADIARIQAQVEQERNRLEREAADRRDRMEREDRERAAMSERQREIDREHFERMAKLENEKRDPLATTIATLTGILTAGKDLGIDLPSMLKGEKSEASGGWPEALISQIGGVVQTFIKAQAQVATGHAQQEVEEGEDEEEEDPIVQVRFSDGSVRQMKQSEAHAMQQAQARPQLPGPVAGANMPAASIPGATSNVPVMPPVGPPPPADNVVYFTPGAQPAAPQEAQAAPAAPVLPPPAPPKVKSPAEAMMSMGDVKAARAAARSLVAKLEREPESNWMTTIVGALSTDTRLATYLQAVTLEGAFVEVNVNPDLAAKIMAAVEKSGMVDAKMLRVGGVK